MFAGWDSCPRLRKNMFIKLNKNRGVTLVEILVAVSILALVLGSMLYAFLVARAGVSLAGHSMEAINAVRALTEQLKGYGYNSSELSIGTHNINAGSPLYVLSDTNIETLNAAISYVVTEITEIDGSVYKEVIVTVTWNEYTIGGATNTVTEQLTTYISG